MSMSKEFRKYLINILNGGKLDPYKYELKIETAKEYFLNKWLFKKIHNKVAWIRDRYYVRLAWIMYHCFCKMPETMELSPELNTTKYIFYEYPCALNECINLEIVDGRGMYDMYKIIVNQYAETYVNEIIIAYNNYLYKLCHIEKECEYQYHFEYDIITHKLVNYGVSILYDICNIPLNGRKRDDVIKEIFNHQEVSPYLIETPKPLHDKFNKIVEKLKKLDSEKDQCIEMLKKYESEKDQHIEMLKKIFNDSLQDEENDDEGSQVLFDLKKIYSERIMLIEKLKEINSGKKQFTKQIRKLVNEL